MEFHAIYNRMDGSEGKVKGSWKGYPPGWHGWSKEGRYDYIHQLALELGMPKDGIIQRFWVD